MIEYLSTSRRVKVSIFSVLLRLNTSNSVIRPNTWPYFDLAEGHLSSGGAEASLETASWTVLRIRKEATASMLRSVCHISRALITCARQTVSENSAEVFPRAADTVKKISTRQIFFLWCGTADAPSVFEVILGGSLGGMDGGGWRRSK